MEQNDYISFVERFVRAWTDYAEYIQKLTGLKTRGLRGVQGCAESLKVRRPTPSC